MARATAGLTRAEWRRLAGMAAAIVALHAVGFGLLLLVVAPAHLSLGTQTFGVGLGLTAYTLGMRHAFDADHIAAVDNTTRKLMAERTRPLSVGFWFSLGHSTIVFSMCVLLSLGIRSVIGQVRDDNSTLHTVTGTVGVAVSGGFLILLGLVNLAALVAIAKVFRTMRTQALDEAELEDLLANRGLLNRVLGRATRAVRKPWHMYPVGVLFGFGFDTATEISLLVLASTSAALALPWYAIMCLPVLFTAGMCLFDTMDGSFMNFAYGWAFSRPVRKVYYNLTVTTLSVLVALVIGGIELLGLVADKLSLRGGAWRVLGAVGDFDYTGYIVVGLFVGTWLISLAIWRYGRIEERWGGGAG
ncbi:MAG: HoxN/HupN/NixA family nickel/cobalt transporter [Actinomycetia bacterium]|nr:HoxN/HupN/NixA family nickel/cobalt transporter [Actinomycetes bacterium]